MASIFARFKQHLPTQPSNAIARIAIPFSLMGDERISRRGWLFVPTPQIKAYIRLFQNFNQQLNLQKLH
jgi:hypothetical protein